MEIGHSRVFGLMAWMILLATGAATGIAHANTDEPTAEDVAACAACGGIFIIIPLGFLILNIALLVWVARDAKNRGMDNAVVWMILVMITGLIGLVIYLLSRSQGSLIPCPHCNAKRMVASSKCPHCGNP